MKTKKITSLLLAVLMFISCMFLSVNAATTISYSPKPKVEYSYSANVTTGTIRYISQISSSTYFNSNYWGSWANQASIECGTASISMALSYVGVNKTPKTILDTNNGITYFTGWGPSTSNPSVATGMSNYINGNGKYSPPIVHFTTGYSSGTHYVLLIGQVSSNSYLVLDPASNSTWTLSTSDAKYKSIDQVFQYYNPNASSGTHPHSYDTHYEADHPHRVYSKCSCGDWYYTGETKYIASCAQCNEPTTILYPTNGSIVKIASGVGNNMYFDFACTNDNVQIYENCDNHSDPAFVKSQYFRLTHIGDGWYTISNIGNNLAADVATASPESGTNIIQYEHHQGGSQQFRFYDAGDGYCYIKSSLGTYMDVQNGDNVNNTNVWAYSFNGSNAQKWKLESHSHSYSSIVTQAATCTKTGIRTYTCSKCLSSYTETINKIAHTYVSSVTTQPTCTKTGVKTYKCNCGTSYTETIATTSHNSNTIIPAVAATCAKTGLTEGKKCSVCGTITVAQNTVAKKSHSHTSKVTTHATHLTEGVMTYTCDCGDTYTEVIAKTPEHTYAAKVTAPTCTEQGYTTYTCECNDTYVADFVDATGHSHEAAVTTPATHLKEGVMTYTCACGDTYTEVIAKTPEHTYNAVVTAPTCTEQGYTTYTCACGDSYDADFVGKISHNDADKDGYCDSCNEFLGTENEESKCSHMCHKTGFVGFIWKIINFFCKLFGINPVCECGKAHY